jgi:hypothetical protein
VAESDPLGEVKELMNKVADAKKVAEVNLAKLLANNPALMRLRELTDHEAAQRYDEQQLIRA